MIVSNVDILPCPFCKGRGVLHSPVYPIAADCDDAMVICDDCEASGPSVLCSMDHADAEQDWPNACIEAIRVWNIRADSSLEDRAKSIWLKANMAWDDAPTAREGTTRAIEVITEELRKFQK